MNYDDELDEKPSQTPPEREISLGTGTILGIFFALALLCGGFFGFGYSMGHRSSQAAASTAEPGSAPTKDTANSPFSNFKTAPVADAPETASAPKAEDSPAPTSPSDTATTETASSVTRPPIASDGSWMVQVSATTRRPDAEALTKVLNGKGFAAVVKPEPDQKFHVRVGPFASKKDADVTRKLLVASGYKDPFLTPR